MGGRARLVVALALASLVAGSLLHTWLGYSHEDKHPHAWGLDDAYISFRYAENLASGNGLVFNAGERVEGYSNFLYTLLLAPAFLVVDGMAVYYVAVVLNTIFILIAALLLHDLARRRLGEDRAAIAVLLFALTPPIWVGVASGMETPLVLLLQIATWSGLERVLEGGGRGSMAGLCVSLVLLLLARADGFVWVGLVLGYLLVRERAGAAVRCGGVLLAAALPYLIWRYAYYGDLLPNTFYAKVSGPPLDRVAQALIQLRDIAYGAGLLPYLIGLCFVLVHLLRRADHSLRARVASIPFEVFAASGLLLYWCYIGGDHLGERFLLILFPLGSLALMHWVLCDLRGAPYGLVVVLLAALQIGPLSVDPRFEYTRRKYDLFVVLGGFLGQAHRGQTLAIDAAGKVPYLSGLTTIDMLGLNDRFLGHKDVAFFDVAHNKYDPDYILARRPDLIAAWITADLDLWYGLSRAKYEGAGYRLRYLVSAEKDLGLENILDARRLDNPTVKDLVGRGFYYAVLDRAP